MDRGSKIKKHAREFDDNTRKSSITLSRLKRKSMVSLQLCQPFQQAVVDFKGLSITVKDWQRYSTFLWQIWISWWRLTITWSEVLHLKGVLKVSFTGTKSCTSRRRGLFTQLCRHFWMDRKVYSTKEPWQQSWNTTKEPRKSPNNMP